ncbi:MAG: M4 family metallopeptidase [Chloroflexi bacterium]|nr:M4 family metallopeptidase [Chloroflexota bacterium]MBI3339262.1 M4 family metallopeptidase [Chloroflexota bacterium]
MSHRHSIFCIIPPHMLKEIAQRGSPVQRSLALRTIATSGQIRSQRTAWQAGIAVMAATASAGNKQRAIYDARQGSQLPGTLVRSEGDAPATDIAVNEAYDGAGVTFDLYYGVYGRNSIDNNGLKLNSTVHYQKSYDNAFWDGGQMVYGDGDEDLPPAQRLFNRFTISIDVIGHELTHGVTQYEANLNYSNQPGALNESFSDVFGSLVKQYQLQQTADQADWLIGQGLLTANVNGVGLRSMKAPGTAYNDPVLGRDPQPDSMSGYVTTTEDNGGVHINSGIPNRAFYTTAVEIGGFAWQKAGLIWYKTLSEKLNTNSNFQNAADLTFQTAGEIYGVGSLEQNAVAKGWQAVGITVNASGGIPTPQPQPQPGPGCLTAVLRIFGLAR